MWSGDATATAMAKYKLHFYCSECGDTYEFPKPLSLDDGPAEQGTIDETYRGKRLPPEVARIMANRIECANTGRWTQQAEGTQVFLVPVGDT